MDNAITVNGKGLVNRALAMEILKTPGKRPKTYGGALEMCRKGRGWSVPDLISHAVRGATRLEVAKWEAGDEYPPPRFTELLRKFLPNIRGFDDLLPPGLREDPGAKRKRAAEPEAPVAPPPTPDGWRGPPQPTFGLAMKYCREKAGLSQTDLGRLMGVTPHTIGSWELMRASDQQTEFRIIQGSYENICEILPMLRFGPKPKFSLRFMNQRVTENVIKAREARGDAARADKVVKDAVAAHVSANTPKPVDEAPATMAGAIYGAAASRVATLKVKLKRITEEYMIAKSRIEGEIGDAETEMLKANEEMERVAHQVHGMEASK